MTANKVIDDYIIQKWKTNAKTLNKNKLNASSELKYDSTKYQAHYIHNNNYLFAILLPWHLKDKCETQIYELDAVITMQWIKIKISKYQMDRIKEEHLNHWIWSSSNHKFKVWKKNKDYISLCLHFSTKLINDIPSITILTINTNNKQLINVQKIKQLKCYNSLRNGDIMPRYNTFIFYVDHHNKCKILIEDDFKLHSSSVEIKCAEIDEEKGQLKYIDSFTWKRYRMRYVLEVDNGKKIYVFDSELSDEYKQHENIYVHQHKEWHYMPKPWNIKPAILNLRCMVAIKGWIVVFDSRRGNITLLSTNSNAWFESELLKLPICAKFEAINTYDKLRDQYCITRYTNQIKSKKSRELAIYEIRIIQKFYHSEYIFLMCHNVLSCYDMVYGSEINYQKYHQSFEGSCWKFNADLLFDKK